MKAETKLPVFQRKVFPYLILSEIDFVLFCSIFFLVYLYTLNQIKMIFILWTSVFHPLNSKLEQKNQSFFLVIPLEVIQSISSF